MRYGTLKPDWMPDKAWDTIIECWSNGLTDREASFRALEDSDVKITPKDIKEMVAESPEIAQLKDYLSSNIESMAKLNIVDEIRDGNASISKWYLEKRSPEFATKAAVQFEASVTELTLADKQDAMEDFMKQFERVKDEHEGT